MIRCGLIFILLVLTQIVAAQDNASAAYKNIVVVLPEPVMTGQKTFDNFMANARQAFIDKNYEKCYISVKAIDKTGGDHSGAFWFYLGMSCDARGDVGACKRYLKQGYRVCKSVECKEAYEKLYKRVLK